MAPKALKMAPMAPEMAPIAPEMGPMAPISPICLPTSITSYMSAIHIYIKGKTGNQPSVDIR